MMRITMILQTMIQILYLQLMRITRNLQMICLESIKRQNNGLINYVYRYLSEYAISIELRHRDAVHMLIVY